ncbi:Phosphoribosyl transferase domain-containing protein [Streptomyces sp. cf386]|uniref:phosphoribosyltransferase family protein n=1 Tax=Streptomyces sp. cf386 TaxID=1761904 RepID=UPI0008905E58|nr:phosphoribosyltransferase family protein [Streptomyces sp. cf386]SDN52877.1 Phosphoribosyl transferase domain-containing protein [Streptomyces sp. cf386]
MRYDDRREAGRLLAERLQELRGRDVVVLGLPRGGVPVAAEVARGLGAPLDVLVVRKLGVPEQPEWGFGAIGEHGVRVLNEDVIDAAGLRAGEREAVEEAERGELERRVRSYRRERTALPVAGRTAVVVDDGLATGATAEAACRVVRGQGAARIVLAVPVGARHSVARLERVADDVVCPHTLQVLGSVGAWYRDFTQVTDAEVTSLLAAAARSPTAPAATSPSDREVLVPAAGARVGARLVVPDGAPAAVAFAHGSGSSRHSPRNQYVATALNRAGLATLLLDLLTDGEAQDRHNVFDILLLARRLHAASVWLRGETGLPVAYFGASTGAAAALEAAALSGSDVRSVVSRGGRPDLATPAALTRLRAPTLLIVGSRDAQVLSLNRLAADRMHCEHRIAVVPGATHLFEEPGTLTIVAELARDWFTAHLDRPGTGAPRRSA